VIINRRTYPVKQVGEVITRQDAVTSPPRSDPGDDESRLHLPFGRRVGPGPAPALSPLEAASALLGAPDQI